MRDEFAKRPYCFLVIQFSRLALLFLGCPILAVTVSTQTLPALLDIDFPERLVQLRKARTLTQRQLAELVSVHFTQLQRYEAGNSQPTLDVLRRLAVALGVSADVLLFDKDERGPDEALKLKFEALREFNPDERRIAEGVLDSLIVQHQAKRLFAQPASVPAVATTATPTPPSGSANGRRASRLNDESRWPASLGIAALSPTYAG